jgi:hypothetical protein
MPNLARFTLRHRLLCGSKWPRGLWHEMSSLAWTLGSHSRHWYLRLFCVCVGSGLATGWSPVQGVLPIVFGLRDWSYTKHFTDALCSKWAQQERERDTLSLKRVELKICDGYNRIGSEASALLASRPLVFIYFIWYFGVIKFVLLFGF